MLKINGDDFARLEKNYPGITDQIMSRENETLPDCPNCMSNDTAEVNVGFIGRTITIGACTTKFKLIGNGPKPGRYFCNICKKYFDDEAVHE